MREAILHRDDRARPLRAVRRVLDPLAVFAAAFALYGALAQHTVYGVDGWVLLRRLSAGDLRSDMHLAFKPVAYLGIRAFESLGFGLHSAAVATCALFTAVGLALLYASLARLGTPRRSAWLVTIGAAVTPGIAFFATVMERHGVFMLGVGLAFLAGAQLAVRPGPARAVWTSIAIAVAYSLHSTGALLTAIILPLTVVGARRFHPGISWCAGLRPAGLALLCSVAACFAARKLAVAAGFMEHEGASLEFFLVHARTHLAQPGMLPGAVWNELIIPFAPFSFTWLVAWRNASLRPLAAAVSIGVLAYAALAFLLLGDFGERGAYSLPLAVPFVGLTLLALGPRATWIAVVIAAALAFVQIRRHDDRHLDPVATGVRAIAGERPFLLPAAPSDFEMIYLDFPGLQPNEDFWDAFDAKGFPADVLAANAELLGAYLDSKIDGGRALLMSRAGREELMKPVDPGQAGPMVIDVLERHFRFEPVRVGGFDGFRLVRS